jgi:biopolymer transport protein ExbB
MKAWTSCPRPPYSAAFAEAGLKASQGGTTLVGLSDWIGMTLHPPAGRRQCPSAGRHRLLGSVGSVSPFVGLLGTVMGILNALIGIGVAGQASIDKVAGPVGEALIMTAIGLFVAVPAVLLYNYLIRRNKVITEKLRAFAGRPAGLSHQQEQVVARARDSHPEIKPWPSTSNMPSKMMKRN